MKKSFILLLLAAMVLPISAQKVETTQEFPITMRNGNTYIVEKQVLDKRAYEGYLKNTCPQAFDKFHSGRVIANTGWGLFGGGLAMETGSLIAMFAVAMSPQSSAEERKKALQAPLVSYYASSALTISGITCLIVGYVKMHNSVDIYNVMAANTKPQASLSVHAGGDGIGLALNF